MLSSKLIQLIETHSESITNQIVREVHGDRRLPHLARLPEGELRERARDILHPLGHWLAVSQQHETAKHFEGIGAERFEEAIPLHEVVLGYLIVKRRMIDFVREQGIAQTTVAVYAEEELENCVDRFFDGIIYHMVKGYEEALDEAAMAPAHPHSHGRPKQPK